MIQHNRRKYWVWSLLFSFLRLIFVYYEPMLYHKTKNNNNKSIWLMKTCFFLIFFMISLNKWWSVDSTHTTTKQKEEEMMIKRSCKKNTKIDPTLHPLNLNARQNLVISVGLAVFLYLKRREIVRTYFLRLRLRVMH